MPVKYRDIISNDSEGQIIITVDHLDRCLLVYPATQWEKVEQALMALPNMQRRVRNLQRLILGHAAELGMDAQGRFLLPMPLREYAGLKKKAVLVGQVSKFELWDADIWQKARIIWLAEARENEEAGEVLSQISL